MQNANLKRTSLATSLLLAAIAVDARADVITDWNQRTSDVITEAKLGTPPAIRVMALVQTAVDEAVKGAGGASVDAAVAAANRTAMVKLMPAQQATIDAMYKAALAAVPEDAAKAMGIAAGEQAANTVLARRADDKPAADEYRPHAVAGTYVPTATPAVPTWSTRKPWLMASASQFRPGPPPALTSEAWTRDFNEIKTLGGKTSTLRTVEQSDIARFWEYSLPQIYYGVVRSVADAPGRDVARNARLYAAVAQAMDDAMISVFEAKYQYNFWRPVTAVRNGDIDDNAATQRDPSWQPLVDAPMHPEYPSGHAILAASVGAVVKADMGRGVHALLTTASPTAKGAVRSWTHPDAFVQEVSNSRVYAGIHFRSAIDAGMAAGRKIGELAAARHMTQQVASK